MHLSTFSLVARDPKTGQIAVAGGTNWFCYGRWVPHIEAGFGALATQAETNMWYAPNGLNNLKSGMTAKKALNDLLKRDPDKKGIYQLLIIDKNGETVCHTGDSNHEYAGHILEKNLGAAGNTLVSIKTLEAVVNFYKKSSLPFGLRIIKALQKGQEAGGDIRGMKSAAIKVAEGVSTGKYWRDVIYDIRVDESEDPLKELERLYYVAAAYRHMETAEVENDLSRSILYYKKALKLDPKNEEIMFWLANKYCECGEKNKYNQIMRQLKKGKGKWEEFLKRIKQK